MADDSQATIRTIIWRELFPFTNIFRAFRVAIHPSKLLLALVALLLMYIGGSLLDYIWPVRHRAVSGEVTLFQENKNDLRDFKRQRDAVRSGTEAEYAQLLIATNIESDWDKAMAAAKKSERLGVLRKEIVKRRDEAVRQMRQTSPKDLTNIEWVYKDANATYERASSIKNFGLFDSFFHYESAQVNYVVRGVGSGRWIGPGGVFDSIINFLAIGPMWLGTQHPLFFVVFSLMFLLIWSVFGGAIARIAAVHVARDEKMSIRAALRFSFSKLLSFLFAPIIPLLIILVVGLVVTVGALLGNIPFFGPIVVGALFFLVLAAGFIMALVLLGLVGGFNLMYPTIAVEGSDSFDAISRSFSYLYARPWRLAFYTIVAIAYGAITYLFVRLFIFLMLVLTHKAIRYGIFVNADSTTPLWSVMWPSPVANPRLMYDVDTLTLGAGQTIGAYLIWFWVHLVIAMLGAFAISFYFSANSIIYYLMRREVDATEMDDVYLEQSEEDFTEPADVAPAPTPSPAPTIAPDTTSSVNPASPPPV